MTPVEMCHLAAFLASKYPSARVQESSPQFWHALLAEVDDRIPGGADLAAWPPGAVSMVWGRPRTGLCPSRQRYPVAEDPRPPGSPYRRGTYGGTGRSGNDPTHQDWG
jgi:hypothetical protein